MVHVAIATDLVGDGLLIGTGSAVSSDLALALRPVLADVPEGAVEKRERVLISASFVLPVIGTALPRPTNLLGIPVSRQSASSWVLHFSC